MKKPAFIVVDVETTGSDWKKDRLHGVGVCWDEDCTEYRTVPNITPGLEAWLADSSIAKVGHNLRFDVLFLEAAGIKVNGPLYDTMLLAKTLDENQELGLKALAKKYLKDSLDAKNELDRVLGKLKLKHVGQLCLLDFGITEPYDAGAFVNEGRYTDLIGRYCEEDCNNTWRLFTVLKGKLNELDRRVKERFAVKKGPKDVYLEEVSPTERVLIGMEQRGVALDKERQRELGKKLKEEEVRLRGELNAACAAEVAELEERLCGKERSKRVTQKAKDRIQPGSAKYRTKFLWSSPKQVADLVYKQLKVPFGSWQKTEKGQLSVGSQARPRLMLDIGPEHRAFAVLQKYERWYKCKDLYAKYVDGTSPAALNVVEHEGRIHGQFLQLPKTGRLSHRAPNMGNIPKSGDVKALFVPPSPEHVFFYFDYSQVEFRIMAHLCRDKRMLEACHGDPHDATAKLCGVDRNSAKTLNFAFLYGAWPTKAQSIFLTQAGVWKSLQECTDLREAFFAAYPALPDYLQRVKRFVSSNGISLIETGYMRRFPEVFSGGKGEVRSAERKGVNLLGQGLGASITKRAMLKLHGEKYRLVSQVHDAVLGTLEKSQDLRYHVSRIQEIAESAYQLRVPLKAEVKLLNSFDESDVYEIPNKEKKDDERQSVAK